MFDLAWSEIALIVVVALIVIGPKDLPDAVRGAARGIGKLRRMAGEFQGHLDEVVREAKLEDVRDQIRDIRNFDVRGEIERAVDRDGAIRDTFRDDPFRAQPPTPSSDAAPAEPATPVGDGGGTPPATPAPGGAVSGAGMIGAGVADPTMARPGSAPPAERDGDGAATPAAQTYGPPPPRPDAAAPPPAAPSEPRTQSA